MTLRSAFVLATIAASLAGAALTVAIAEVQPVGPALSQSQAGYYRMKVGSVDVIALSDGTIGLDAKLLETSNRRLVDLALKRDHVTSPLNTSVNSYLVKLADKLVLVDSGAGTLFGPSLNKLPASLKAAGFSPEQITDVLITHVHTDHTGGLMDGTRRVFPNATVHLDKRELAFWMDAANEAKAPSEKKAFFQQARASLEPYVTAKQVQTFDGAAQIVPGMRSVPSPGHTPGHSFYRLDSAGETLVFWGDVLHVAQVQLHDPSVTIAFDVDAKAAAAQRSKAFADAADRGYLVAPAHMSYPGIGHLRRVGRGYRWVPIPFIDDASPPAR